MKKYLENKKIIGFLAFILVFIGFCYYRQMQKLCDYEKKLSHINSVMEMNPLLKSCFTNFRKAEFLRRGGQYIPDYENPRTLNDKVGYILDNYYSASPITRVIGTKYLAKKYVADVVGEKHVVKLFGVWNNPEDIEWDKLPNKFVLKSVRGNFGREVILVTDKTKLDISKTVDKLKEFCSVPIMTGIKEKRIIAEEFLEPVGEELIDYKIFCSYGQPIVMDCLSKQKYENTDVKFKTCAFYSIPEWKRLPIVINKHPLNNFLKSKHFNEMMEIASKLSKNFPLIRIDLYEIGDRVLVGELTEDASGAKSIFDRAEWDFKIGELIPTPSKEEILELIERDKEICKKYF